MIAWQILVANISNIHLINKNDICTWDSNIHGQFFGMLHVSIFDEPGHSFLTQVYLKVETPSEIKNLPSVPSLGAILERII